VAVAVVGRDDKEQWLVRTTVEPGDYAYGAVLFTWFITLEWTVVRSQIWIH
jgi:hypothetical protein